MTLPRAATQIAHGYTLADVYDIAVHAVRTDYWRPSLEWTERVEAAWSAVATALCAAEEPPRRGELILIARDASQDVIEGRMRHRGKDKRGATFGASRVNFERFWFLLPRTGVEDRVVDAVSLEQIWPCLKPGFQEALVALAVHGDYALAAEALGLQYYTFCARVRHARNQFLSYWHEGEVPSSVWGRDKRKGRDTANTAVRVLARRKSRITNSQGGGTS